MKRFLIVVDMQNDFVDGVLGTKEAVEIVDRVVAKIHGFNGRIIVTKDTHRENYLATREGRNLPVEHCIQGTDGWELNAQVAAALSGREYIVVNKPTFGSVELPGIILNDADEEEFSIELIGLCTDICVVSNALLLKAHFPESYISVDANCCAGVSPQTHAAALTTMKMCQIAVI